MPQRRRTTNEEQAIRNALARMSERAARHEHGDRDIAIVGASDAAVTLADWANQYETSKRQLSPYAAQGSRLRIVRRRHEALCLKGVQWSERGDLNLASTLPGDVIWLTFVLDGQTWLAGAACFETARWELFRCKLNEDGEFVTPESWYKNRKRHAQAKRNGPRVTLKRRERRKRNPSPLCKSQRRWRRKRYGQS